MSADERVFQPIIDTTTRSPSQGAANTGSLFDNRPSSYQSSDQSGNIELTEISNVNDTVASSTPGTEDPEPGSDAPTNEQGQAPHRTPGQILRTLQRAHPELWSSFSNYIGASQSQGGVTGRFSEVTFDVQPMDIVDRGIQLKALTKLESEDPDRYAEFVSWKKDVTNKSRGNSTRFKEWVDNPSFRGFAAAIVEQERAKQGGGVAVEGFISQLRRSRVLQVSDGSRTGCVNMRS